MVIKRGQIWWADLPEPVGSNPGYRRPVLVVQDNEFNDSAIKTVIVVAITGNARISKAKGNVMLSSQQSDLPRDSVINVSQLLTLDKSLLFELVSTLSESKLSQVDSGLRLVLSL